MSFDIEKAKRVGALAKQRHQHQDEIDALKELHVKEIRSMQIAAKNVVGKKSRTNDRTEVIAEACKRARTPNDPRSILDALRNIARSGNTFPQLLGYVAVEKVFKWDTGPDEPPKFQTEKDALATIKRHIKKNAR